MVCELKRVNISVVDLAEMCRTGDIHHRFSTHSSAQEGIAAHVLVQKGRESFYKSEYSVEHEVVCGSYLIKVGGRIDGWLQTADGLCVDEIKSIRLPPHDIPKSVLEQYWCQANFYAFMLAREKYLSEVRVRLCLFHLDEKKEYWLERTYQICELTIKFVEGIMLLVGRLDRRDRWQKIRSYANSSLTFPYEDYRPGQRDMAVSVFRQLNNGGQLVLQAPTGLGKTIGTIFPAIHALECSENQRIFYLSAKSSTQKIAESAVKDLMGNGGRLRSVTITAKDKICFNQGVPCDSKYCQYAKGYYDRVHGAISDMLDQQDQFDRESIQKFALKHRICPFELSLDVSLEADLIICDYNYVLDPSVYLRRYFNSSCRDSLALVDEAHNLIDRGREMYSAEIEDAQILYVARQVKNRSPVLFRAAIAVISEFLVIRKMDSKFSSRGYLLQKKIPERIIGFLQKLTFVMEEFVVKEGKTEFSDKLISVYSNIQRFIRTAEEYDDDYMTVLSKPREGLIKLKLFCVDPSKRLAVGFSKLSGVACFSATLQPQTYFKDLLGISDKAHWYRLPSPYPEQNLHVSVVSIDTSYRFRESSINSVVRVIDKVSSSRAGGYIVFFPSYKYLELVSKAFSYSHPQKKIVMERRSMSEQEKQDYLRNFSGEPVCGFAVMSGAFSEGIDLKGERLIGAIIIGVGLPGLGVERDIISQRYKDKGFEFAYQYPGMLRVVQTAGRVIRSPEDKGVICLVDSRYQQARYKRLFPEYWKVNDVESIANLMRDLSQFWDEN